MGAMKDFSNKNVAIADEEGALETVEGVIRSVVFHNEASGYTLPSLSLRAQERLRLSEKLKPHGKEKKFPPRGIG